MATQVARTLGHTSGIYADMTVDGPDIGTLVVVVDRAKNLPNLKTMGKQDPYCATRLGKEAKKTETDRRGGQTPKWDQELRFTVHDSADYYNLKVSVFNDDKRTDLIGETWINLEAVVIPGGGQGDSWHSLNCKGRYAGEIRIELTYYDIRPKMEKPRENGRERKQSESDTGAPVQNAHMAGFRQLPPVRRRPLPPGPTHSSPSLSMNSDRHSPAPLPQLAPRNYHNSPRQDIVPITYSEGSEQTQHGRVDQSALGPAVAYPRSLPNNSPVPRDTYHTGSGSIAPLRAQRSHGSYTSSPYDTADRNDQIKYQEPFFAEPDPVDDYIEYTDDPYALEVVEAGQDYTQQYETHTDTARLRNDRVQTLSSRPHYRPPIHHAGLPHAHSTPILGSHEQPGESQLHGDDHNWQMSESYESSSPRDANFGNLSHQSPSHSPSFGPLSEHFGQPSNYGAPPPPPIHSNSAPVVPGLAPRPPPARYHTNQQGRPLHVPTSVHDLPPDPNQAQQHSPHQRRYPHTALFQAQPQLAYLRRDHTFPLRDGVPKTRTCRRFKIPELVLTMLRLLGMSITHPGEQRMLASTLDEMLAALRLEAFKI